MDDRAVVKVELRGKDGILIPALVIADGDRIGFCPELLASTVKLAANGWSRSHLDRYVLAVRQLVQYYQAVGAPTLDEDGLQALVWNHLSARLYGSVGLDQVDALGLYWGPSRWATVRHDCRAIADFSKFCAASYGYFPLLQETRVPHAEGGLSHIELQKLKTIVERSFLGHLRLLGKERVGLPMPSRKQPNTSGIGRLVLTEQQAWDVIDAEKNPQSRMNWLLGFFGGPRISEQLNMWRNDVLPAACRDVLFRDDPFRESCLVVLANPWESTYCAALGDATQTRRKFLRERYQLLPRPDLKTHGDGEKKGLWAGWKTMLETNENRHISQIFWASNDAASEYWRLHAWLMERHADLRTGQRHPYLHINLDPRQPDRMGEPMTLSNVGKAFERAVRRVGLEPYRFGVNRHGMRHFYKALLTERGLDSKARKLFMHHRSIESQDPYGGVNAMAISHALHLGRRRPRLGHENE